MPIKKFTAIGVIWVPFVLYTMDVFAQNVGFTRYIFQRRSERLILLEDGMDLSRQALPGIFINRQVDLGQQTVPIRDIDFSRCSFYGSDLSDTDFSNCSFRYAHLGGITARNSNFDGCDFTGADITGSDVFLSKEQLMTTASFRRKDLTGYRFQGNFSGVDFSGFDLSGALFITDRGISSFNPTLKDCDFSNAKISATALYHSIPPKTIIRDRMTREQLQSTKDFRQGCVLNVILESFDFSEMDLSGMNFTGCGLWSANFKNTDLTNTVINDCNFDSAKDLTLDQIKSTWNYKVGRMEGIRLPKELQEALDAERHSGKQSP